MHWRGIVPGFVASCGLLPMLLGGCGGEDGTSAPPVSGGRVSAEPGIAEKRAWSGAKVYDEVCDICHRMGVDEAPIVGDAGAWEGRIAKGRDVLFDHVVNGFNRMPPRGSCSFCTDEQLRAAMNHMIEQSR